MPEFFLLEVELVALEKKWQQNKQVNLTMLGGDMLDPQTTNPPNTTNHQPFWGMPSLEKGPLTPLQMHTFGAHTHRASCCQKLQNPFIKGRTPFQQGYA